MISEPTNTDKQEIRTLEGKLIKHFSEQLATKAALSAQKRDISCISHYPSLNQWLKVVGITKESAEIIERNVETLEELKTKKDVDLNRYLIQVCNFFYEIFTLTRIKNQQKIHKCFQARG